MKRDPGAPRRRAPQQRPSTVQRPLPVPLTHPGFLIAALGAIAALVVSVTFRFFDYDLWEHLVVGKYIWTAHTIPTTQLWTWPTYGQPAMIPSWTFRVLLWPFWERGGVTGLFAWRWLTTLATFGFLFLTARRRGSHPIVALAILVLCALPYRGRTMVRPETLAYVLFAAQLWILAARRQAAGHGAWLVLIAWIWINVHISFYIGLVALAFHAVGERVPRARSGMRDRAHAPEQGTSAATWLLVGFGAFAISLLNPYGWKAVAQPLELLLHGRSEAIYQTVTELGGFDWRLHWKDGLPILMVGWPLLLVWRARRRGLDRTEALMCLFLTAQTLFSQRLRGFYALAAAAWLARDLTEFLAQRRRTPLAWPLGLQGAVACLVMLGSGWMEWAQRQFPIGIGLEMAYVPVRACDAIGAYGIRGRAFNHFWYGGYMEYRFWPDRGRLPFMDGHLESGTERDRTLYTEAQSNRAVWQELDREKRFDYALLALRIPVGIPLREFIEADTTWTPVFIDDVAALYVRRNGPLASVAERHGYRLLRVGSTAIDGLMTRCTGDPALRAAVMRELERQVAESPYTAVAQRLLASIALMEGRHADAERHWQQARAAVPRLEAR